MTKIKNVSLILVAVIFVFALAALVLSQPIAAKSENANSNSSGRPSSASPSPSVSVSASASPSPSASVSASPSATPKNKGQVTAQEHQSAVANFVQTLLKTADREKGGIGEQVRLVVQEQNQAEASTTEAITKVENRSKIKTFLLGSDYKNLGALRSQMVQTRNNIRQLNNFMTQTKNASSTAELQLQVQTLEQEQTKIEDFIKAQEGKFSLFGWLVKLFQ